MTDTPTIALYYKEHDPMKRKMFLDQSIAAGEDEETNAVRKEIWEIRYGGPSELGPDTRADGYLALWPWNTVKMLLEECLAVREHARKLRRILPE